jgi:type II secretory pathway predicted ATPase ExeA
MIETTEHLSESAQTALTLPVEERIRRIRSPRWIGYSRAQAILNKLETLLTHPKIHRMPGLLLVGETNAGKTMIANRFAQRYPARDNIEGEAASVPVLVIQAPPVPDENRFYVTILETLFAPYRLRDSLAGKQFQVMQLLRRVELRLLIIDEIQHILAGHATKQRQFLNVLKYLGNELQIPLVGVGRHQGGNPCHPD